MKGDNLSEEAMFVETIHWGTNANLQKVFDIILKVSKRRKLRCNQMPKRVSAFSDMELDEALMNPWETQLPGHQEEVRRGGLQRRHPTDCVSGT